MRRSDRPWVILGVLGVVLTALVTILLMRGCGAADGADDAAGAAPPSATTERPSPTPIPSPTPTPTAATSAEAAGADDRAEGAAAGAGDVDGDDGAAADEGAATDEGAAAGAGAVEPLPLWGPGELPDSGSSDVPAAGEDLVEGDYFVQVTGFHPTARIIYFDVQQLLLGEAAVQYLLVHDPTAEIPPPNGYVLVNESDALRGMALADDARLWDWCFDGGAVSSAERTFDEWVDAFFDGWSQECSAGADLGHGAYLFWLQVREGEVERVIGQYLP